MNQWINNLIQKHPNPEVIDVPDLDELDREFLAEDGFVRLFPAYRWQQIDRNDFRAWCMKRARYLIPTIELVEWLRDQIAGRSAIEVAAGMGDLGHHLGIPMYDNYHQILMPKVALYYQMLGQTPTNPPPRVVQMDAEHAVRSSKAEIVIAAWMTQKWEPGDANGCDYGANEKYIVRRADYIHIGNQDTHGDKRIISLPHETFKMNWIVSRASNPDRNVIQVWRKKP